MKIAVSTADGKTICGHLGKCRSFIIYDTDGREVRQKRVLNVGALCPGHGDDKGTHNVSPFEGCHAVITQGMGQGMMDGLIKANITPVITDQSDPDAAVMKFIGGELSGTVQSSCSCGEH